MSDMTVFGTLDRMKKARKDLGSPAALDEALVATGIDAFFHLIDGGTLTIEGKTYRLVSNDE